MSLQHTFWAYRRENPDSKVGDPPPGGSPGFNSGVMLLDLEAMRRSEPYNQLLEPQLSLPGYTCILHLCSLSLARKQRHTFWAYRRENPDSKVGDPPPGGSPGFNSGVMLLDLEAMRRSEPYNQLLEPQSVSRLADKYRFQGHLGDQDFFTMIGMEHPSLFHVLDCAWNRQLCTWWKDHGYGDVFQLYYHCQGPVKIYHGNCNTPIPDD
ncbi:UNVERIFIED_CONTAM: hypothetical protein FKN15_041649 [Acipenser sinensis]